MQRSINYNIASRISIKECMTKKQVLNLDFPFVDPALFVFELQPCNIDVCLTWSATKEKISFKCKVNALLFTVKFFNQLHQEQAYCASPIPHVLCFPLLSNSNITQDVVHNITILTLERRIDDRINGAWTCCHGTNVDKAVVNVTVLRRGEMSF
ncbi:unnamed protein product [Mytilus edulis]|uniref:Uncharacterized protein n=1 Tax=Mytilus edulis TaxID=6550 RepID=A0A8S3QTJ8_MYTED|nr:unnamed protein product [Mytilus edulis]